MFEILRNFFEIFEIIFLPALRYIPKPCMVAI